MGRRLGEPAPSVLAALPDQSRPSAVSPPLGRPAHASNGAGGSHAAAALAGQNQILLLLATGAPLEEILDALCRHLESLIDGAHCALLLLDDDGARVCRGHAPTLPQDVLAAFDRIEIASGAGTRSFATDRWEPVIRADSAVDPLFASFRDVLLAHGLHSCWSVPILDPVTNQILGIFAISQRASRLPSTPELSRVEETSQLAAIAIRSRRTEDALRQSEARFRVLVRNAPDIIALLDADGTLCYQSPALERVLECGPDQFVGTNVLTLIHPEDVHRAELSVAELLASPGQLVVTELRLRRRDGTFRDLEVTMTNLLDDPNVGKIVVNARDMTERKAIAHRLLHQATHDPLTGLPNRTLFMERLAKALERHESNRVALFFLDLDHFKVVNDSLGHAIGDRLLLSIGQRLVSALRAGDLVARFGGDEFVILLEDLTDPSNAEGTAERLLATLYRPHTIEWRELVIDASIGIAIASPALADPGDLLRAADVALYRAKRAGRGGYAVFDPDTDAPALERLERETELRHAFKRGEFRVAYQPIVDLGTDSVRGLEALARWQHPTRGLLSPAEFIPLAEETGLILPIGRWVIREACRHVRAWQKRFPRASPLQLSVNLSSRQLCEPRLAGELAKVLRETGLAPGTLVLDVGEGTALADSPVTLATLTGLRHIGVTVAIDDFGTDQAALGSLRRLAVDDLKIDGSRVAGLGHDQEDTAIVRAVVGVAKAVGLTVTAEGVETAEQLLLLRKLGCDRAQGHHFSPPLAAEEVEDFLRRRAGAAAPYLPLLDAPPIARS